MCYYCVGVSAYVVFHCSRLSYVFVGVTVFCWGGVTVFCVVSCVLVAYSMFVVFVNGVLLLFNMCFKGCVRCSYVSLRACGNYYMRVLRNAYV